MEPISSRDNPRLKSARSLQRKKERLKTGRFLIEGVRLVEEALLRGATLLEAFVSPDFAAAETGRDLIGGLERSGSHVVSVPERLLAEIAGTETPQGIVAVARIPDLPVEAGENPLFLVLDGVRDPGNAGTILRTAQAAGVDAVFVLKGTADVWSPKVVRAGMGAHFALPIREIQSIDELPPVAQLLVAESAGGTPYYDIDWARPTALVVGGEAAGASAETKRRATRRVFIPMARETESLNAAVAAAVILFESFRGRRFTN